MSKTKGIAKNENEVSLIGLKEMIVAAIKVKYKSVSAFSRSKDAKELFGKNAANLENQRY